jgi:nucleoside-diphosphate-sugar epimerase
VTRRQALVTGGAGFLGRYFCAELERRGWDVISVDLQDMDIPLIGPTTRVHLKNNLHSVLWKTLAPGSGSSRFDLVVHCAATAPNRVAIDTTPSNLVLDVALDSDILDWALQTRPGRFLYVSSSAVYPVKYQSYGAVGMLLQEDLVKLDPPSLDTPDARYGLTKLTGEHMALAAREAGLAVSVVRPFSGYGVKQSRRFPFRAFLERAQRREDPFEIWGNARQVRDWIHVTDVVNGALAVAEHEVDEPINVCTGVSTSMTHLAHLFAAAVNYRPDILTKTDAPMGVFHRVGDPTRFFRVYEPQITIEQGVREAVRYAGTRGT